MDRNKSYCINNECPYSTCDKHSSQLKEQTSKRTFVEYDKVCRKYISWLAYSNYEKYVELKEGIKNEYIRTNNTSMSK